MKKETRLTKECTVSISKGNSKMGAIPSVSLPAIITCPKGCPCAKYCYAHKLERIRKNVREAYQRNLRILCQNPESYWDQVRTAARNNPFFRFHVSGDIPNAKYFNQMIETVSECKNTLFLVFTKRYAIVNAYLDKTNGVLPENLIAIFSEAGDGWEVPNPYNLPTSIVLFKGDELPENTWHCTGNCMSCAMSRTGCFGLKRGEHVGFDKH